MNASRAIALGAVRGKWMRLAEADKTSLRNASEKVLEDVLGAVNAFVAELVAAKPTNTFTHEHEGGSYFIPLPESCDPWAMLAPQRAELAQELHTKGWEFTFYGDLEEKRHCIWIWMNDGEDEEGGDV